jgi:hypothetical protein
MAGNRAEIMELLEQLSGGEFVAGLDDKLAKVREHVAETGAPASLTITLSLKREPGSNFPVQINVQPGSKISLSELKPSPTAFYQQSDNRLSRRDPRQPSLFGEGKDDGGQGGGKESAPVPGQGVDGKPLKN